MPTYLDLDAWPRRSHFDFFRRFDQPFFNLCAPVEVTALVEHCRAAGRSFFLASLYLVHRVSQEVEPFRYRLRGDRVLVHETLDVGATVLRDDETFTFVHFPHAGDFETFERRGLELLEEARRSETPLDPRDPQDDVIHVSVLPWVAFTSISHARRWGREDSVPKIGLGKHHRRDGELGGGPCWLPVSVEVHHALMDGLHAGRFFERLGELAAEPTPALGW